MKPKGISKGKLRKQRENAERAERVRKVADALHYAKTLAQIPDHVVPTPGAGADEGFRR